ncbi:hypothetical protein B4Q05_20410 [Acinetobacter baumannii]|nr:hypothetical protein B4Q05_20410 [Acinetobacter baumannii]
MASYPSCSKSSEIPKPSLASWVPAIDWNIKSIGTFFSAWLEQQGIFKQQNSQICWADHMPDQFSRLLMN